MKINQNIWGDLFDLKHGFLVRMVNQNYVVYECNDHYTTVILSKASDISEKMSPKWNYWVCSENFSINYGIRNIRSDSFGKTLYTGNFQAFRNHFVQMRITQRLFIELVHSFECMHYVIWIFRNLKVAKIYHMHQETTTFSDNQSVPSKQIIHTSIFQISTKKPDNC